VLSWYDAHNGELKLMNNSSTVTVVIGGTPLKIDANGVLQKPSAGDLINNAKYSPGSWNEIGKA
jgi:hypothetical protein